MKTSGKVLAMAALLSGALLACAAYAATPPDGVGRIKVTVLIYSGRQDPSFDVDAVADLDRLRQLLAAAHPDTGQQGTTVLPSILGYNGLVIENRSGLSGVPAFVAVYRNRVEVRTPGSATAATFLADGGELEQFLLDQAVQRKALTAVEQRLIETSRKTGSPGKP